jgi:hypothetical protein
VIDHTTIEVQFSAQDEKGREILEALNQFPEYSLERAEMEGHLFMVLARVSWREADRIRLLERRQGRRRAK